MRCRFSVFWIDVLLSPTLHLEYYHTWSIKLPILFATDAATDVGQIAEANNFGLWTVSGNLTQFYGYDTIYVRE